MTIRKAAKDSFYKDMARLFDEIKTLAASEDLFRLALKAQKLSEAFEIVDNLTVLDKKSLKILEEN